MYSRSFIPVNGSTRLFTVPFPFLSSTHVKFILNRVYQHDPLDYVWVGPTQVEFVSAPSTGVLEIRRETPIDAALVQFQNGSVLTEQELNLAVLQNLYISQETRENYDTLVDGTLDLLVEQAGGGTNEPVLDRVIQEILSSSLLSDLSARIADIDLNAYTINAQRIRLDTVEEVVDALADVNGEQIATFLIAEQEARIEGDTALASDISLIGAKSGDGLSFNLDLAKVKVSPTESVGQRLNGIQSSMAANTAAITAEANTRATANTAMSSRVGVVEANVAGNTAQIAAVDVAAVNRDNALTTSINQANSRIGAAEGLIQTEQTTRAAADSAAATRMDGLEAQVGGTRADILTEQSARVAGDNALATQANTIQTTVNGHTASIQTQATSINGLHAQYTVKVDNNGYVAGYGLASTAVNGAPTSSFIVRADTFSIVSPAGGARLEYSANNMRIYDSAGTLRVRLGVW